VKSECAREQDVLDAIQAGRWSDDHEDEGREHARRCNVCADLGRVAGALSEESSELQDVRVPPAGVVWWKAQWLAAAAAAGVAAAAVGIASPWARGWTAWVVGAARQFQLPEMAALSDAMHANTTLLVALALPVLIAPVIVYLTVERD
jgi:hypothetical protein